MKGIRRLWKDESGASAVEYALALALIGSVLIVSVLFLSGTIGGSIEQTGDCIAHSNAC